MSERDAEMVALRERAERAEAARDSYRAIAEIGPAVCDLYLCESQRLVLKPGILYRFRVDPACPRCRAVEAEGSPYAHAGPHRLRPEPTP